MLAIIFVIYLYQNRRKFPQAWQQMQMQMQHLQYVYNFT